MSLVRPLLNRWLLSTEKPYLSEASDPLKVRRGFERKARLFFHAPLGTIHAPCRIGARPGLRVSAGKYPGPAHVLYLHGGAYVFGSPATHAGMLGKLCAVCGATATLPDYRKAPEDPFPAAVEDAEAAWLDLLQQGIDPARCVIGGDSAGGGLALALLALLLRNGYPLPAGLFALSPLTDLTFSGSSLRHNADAEVILPVGRVHEIAAMYLCGHDPEDLRASPLFADFTGAPPVWLTAGDTEILLDDTTRMAVRLKAQGVPTDLSVARNLPHVWPIFHNYLPEARATLRDLGRWIRQRTGTTAEN